MGVDIGNILNKRAISLPDLKGKAIVVDGHNTLYQFLTIIRDATGRPLRDRSGRITSHLSGLFYRNLNLLGYGIKLIYVFDGKPPELKAAELARRAKLKEESLKKYEEALREGRIEEAKKYAAISTKVEPEIVEDAIRLLEAMGIPALVAPSEGEAQAAFIVRKGGAWAVASQDYDSLLFGASNVVRNIAITGKRKLPGKNIYVEVELEHISLEETLSELGITREQLVDIGILVGTDYNPEGVKGIGPKRALELVKRYGRIENIPGISDKLNLALVEEIRHVFLNPEVDGNYRIEWRELNRDKVVEFLCEERDFSRERVNKALDEYEKKLEELRKQERTLSLERWFG